MSPDTGRSPATILSAIQRRLSAARIVSRMKERHRGNPYSTEPDPVALFAPFLVVDKQLDE